MRRQKMPRNIPLFLSSYWNYGSCHQTEERSHENWVNVRKFHPSHPLLPSIISSEHSLRFSEQFQIIFFATVYGVKYIYFFTRLLSPLLHHWPHILSPLLSTPYLCSSPPSSLYLCLSPASFLSLSHYFTTLLSLLTPPPPHTHTHTTIPSHCWPKSLLLTFIQNELIPNSDSEEGKVFYYKMKGDYHRYLAEVNNLNYETIVQ